MLRMISGVIAGLDPAIQTFWTCLPIGEGPPAERLDFRVKPGHDSGGGC